MPNHIAIIGGGYTGLVAAYRLASKTNHQITIFESSKTLGGLAGDFHIHGHPLEKTYHHLFRSDTDILHLIGELDLADNLEWLASSVSILTKGKSHPFVSVLDVLRFSPIPFSSRIRLGVAMLALKRKKDWRNLEKISAIDWVRKYCGKAASHVIWEPLLKGKFDHYSSSISMAWLWARVHIRANSRTSIFEKEKLGYPKGGFALITNKLSEKICQLGVTVHTDARIDLIHKSSPAGIDLVVGENTHHFDSVIFTGSSRAFAKILPQDNLLSEYTNTLRQIPYLSAICLVFSTDQILGDSYWLNINEQDAPFLVFIRHTRMVNPDRYQGHQIYYIGAYRSENHSQLSMSDHELRETWYSYLKKLYPSFDHNKILSENIFRFKDAQHVVDTNYAEKIPSYHTPLEGLFLANFSQVFPEDRGTNYAVREGNKIATKVAQYLQS